MVKFAKSEKKVDNFLDKHTIDLISQPPAPLTPANDPLEGTQSASEAHAEPDKGKPHRPKKSAPRKPAPTSKRSQGPERLTKVVKCLFTPTEDAELRAFVGRLSPTRSLTLSHLVRAYFDLLRHCEDELTQELGRAEITRPINDKTALALFESQLAEVVHSALRRAPLIRSERPEAAE